jgi:hypothetical protein
MGVVRAKTAPDKLRQSFTCSSLPSSIHKMKILAVLNTEHK